MRTSMTTTLPYHQHLSVDLLIAYGRMRERVREKRARKFWRSSAFTLTYIGFICIGVAIAPIAPMIQWYAGEAAQATRNLPRALSKQVAHAEVGVLPQNADKPYVLKARQDALELTGKVHEIKAPRETASVKAPKENSSAVIAAAASNAAKKSNTTAADNRVIIPAIKVDMPIVIGDNGERALLKGAWLIPGTSTFDKGGNSVLSCHRYLYTKGPRTCFNLDKLKEGDAIIVQWNGKQYHYKIRMGKVVSPKEVSILNNTRESILTIFTCTPVFTSKNRLYFIADLVETKSLTKTALK